MINKISFSNNLSSFSNINKNISGINNTDKRKVNAINIKELNLGNSNNKFTNLMEEKNKLKERIQGLKNGDDPILDKLFNRLEEIKKENGKLPEKYNKDSEESVESKENLPEYLDIEISQDAKAMESVETENKEFKHGLHSNEGYMKEFKENGKEMQEIHRAIQKRIEDFNGVTTEEKEEAISTLEEQLKELDNKLTGIGNGNILDTLDAMEISKKSIQDKYFMA